VSNFPAEAEAGDVELDSQHGSLLGYLVARVRRITQRTDYANDHITRIGVQASANQRTLNIDTKTQVEPIIAATGLIGPFYGYMILCIIWRRAIDLADD
jgi:hypothetical protein